MYITHHLSPYSQVSSKTCKVYRPNNQNELHEMVACLHASGHSYSVLGGRFSFGDIFMPEHDYSVDITGLNRIISIDWEAETITVEGGARAYSLAQVLLPHGYYLSA